MTQFWPELRGLFQTIALLYLAPKPGPGEAEPRPCSSAGWAGGWRGGEGRALFVPRFPRASADAAPLGCWIRPWGPSHKSRPRRAAAEAPWGRDRDNLGTPLWGTGAGRRRRGAASARGPEPRDARGVPGVPRPRRPVCFGSGAKAAGRARGTCFPSRASSRGPVKAAAEQRLGPSVDTALQDDAAARAPRRPRPLR